MKILVTGATGQLGHDLMNELDRRGIENRGVGRNDLDLTDAKSVKRFISSYHPDAVIHCAAYTAVDTAEYEKDICMAVNAVGTESIAWACREIDAKLLYISTDYVFPGDGDAFYEINDIPKPLSIYGASKLAGEASVRRITDKYFIVRSSWAFGKNGDNFVKKILRLAQSRDEVSVVCDQFGSPTYTKDLAALLCVYCFNRKIWYLSCHKRGCLLLG
jgi:dTDP-4-dehydrorhamnose reductase